eukprot:TRINITY_DN12719_c0_g1_i1.p1 TRINITY_DN12719_c0_g1~~TRINITY_DN12719_c0_g1_i1.p1  ORF type:complete len:149 (+),score=9.32 TRINITY_DN12719_c0_g1_i1:400-846(+)
MDAVECDSEPILVYHASIDDCLKQPSPNRGVLGCCDGAEYQRPPSLFQATVVYMCLSEWAILKLRPAILQALSVGTRIVTRSCTMGDAWPPDAQSLGEEGQTFFLYTVTADRKADPALNSDTDLAERYGLHWKQPPPGAYNPLPAPAR